MKKFLILLMALAIVCTCFVACDNNDETTADNGSDTTVDGSDNGNETNGPETSSGTQGGSQNQQPDSTGTLAVGEDNDNSFGPVNKG